MVRINDKFAVLTFENTAGKLFNPLKVMGDHQDGGAALAYLVENLHDLVTCLGVQIAGGLIGQYQFGVIKQGTCYADTLLLSA